MTSVATEQAFLDAIERDPTDEGTRLVYADWLEERGESERSRYLRAEVAFHAVEPEPEPRSLFQRLLRRRRDDPVEVARDALAEAGAAVIGTEWLATIARLPIENRACETGTVRFAFECPARWEYLVRTEHPNVRDCQTCHRKVVYCGSVGHARAAAQRGLCVAVDASLTREEGDIGTDHRFTTVGIIDV